LLLNSENIQTLVNQAKKLTNKAISKQSPKMIGKNLGYFSNGIAPVNRQQKGNWPAHAYTVKASQKTQYERSPKHLIYNFLFEKV